ncbi:MAG: AMIN domain-containing protein [Oscillatoriophycideae cyanobacterium NC_groundwater_1537_Pr4_S-0.65um_50_18]|nr:AMIN domain-containing protein [Oscillatoriophycideae cyanobacterium NC_groundwater_1537_Pr4_S-0.65um_50_18]
MQRQSSGGLAFGGLAFGLSIAAIAPLVLTASAWADTLNWSYSPTTQQLEITVTGGTPRYFLAAEPARIVLDLPNTEVDPIATQQTYNTGAIRQIRIAQFQPGQARLVMELAPGTVLAPGQVELRRVNGDRWVLRPLLVGEAATLPETAISPAASPSPAAPPIPRTIATPSMEFPGAIDESAASSDSADSPDDLPPLEPGALQIPVETPSTAAAPPAAPVAPELTNPPSTNPPPTENQPTERQAAIALSVPPPASTPAAELPPATPEQALPPATPSTDRTRPVIQVPTLERSPLPLEQPSSPSPNADVPAPAPPVSLSVLPPAIPRTVIEFGQPLVSRSDADLLLPAGTVFSLRYAGREPIALSSDSSQQEVLLLNQDLRDASGNVIVPMNSEVIGRFETGDRGSQFIAQAVNWQDESLLLNAESDLLRGNRRLLGLLGRSRLRQIEPNQIIEVRLVEDLFR